MKAVKETNGFVGSEHYQTIIYVDTVQIQVPVTWWKRWVHSRHEITKTLTNALLRKRKLIKLCKYLSHELAKQTTSLPMAYHII